MGPWTADAKLAEVGRFMQLTLENDMEGESGNTHVPSAHGWVSSRRQAPLLTYRTGYTLFLWTTVLGKPRDAHQLFLVEMRKFLRNRNVHYYINTRYVYGRKPPI